MSGTEVQDHFEHILAGIRQPARLIGEEWGSGPGFSASADEVRLVLGFPDTYEVGISNQALQVLYHVARCTAGVGVERTYLPWVDALAAMRRERVPLLTIESWTPVAETDLFGITLQHEFAYTNVLEMLDLAGIPLRAADRSEGQPLVIAGGPACADFPPMARFFDAVTVGDGEAILPDVLRLVVEAKRHSWPRGETKRRLGDLPGVYVPGTSRGVTRRIGDHLAGAPYPDSCLVPLTAGVHDRAWIEVMRGCTRGCRFCQAGMWYRPVRERPPGEVLRMVDGQLRATGHEELAFASLSTTDYSCLGEVLEKTAAEHPDVRVSLPSLRVDSAAVRLAHVVSPTGPSLTLAPEAGSERMWKIMNKNVTRADVLAAAEEAFHTGRTTLKLYFMIGLPLEEDADVIAIADLCLAVREAGRGILGPRANRLQLNLSVNNFIPKPFTPFQWAGMLDRETLRHRQELLRSRLRRPGITLTLHGVDKSYLEAALARGGEDMGAVIESAWRHGARFDSWTEQFAAEAWREALREAGTSAEELATTALPLDQPLPWDVIVGVVAPEFLLEEWDKAAREETTPDCRWGGCSDCGACGPGMANDLAAPAAPSAGPSAGFAGAPVPDRVPARAAGGATPASGARPALRWRYLATFAVTGRGRYIGHLDRAEIFRRAVRRAGGRLAQSGGMRPKPLLSLALPLAVGVEAQRELCEFELQHEAGPDFALRLAATLPGHISLVEVAPYADARSAAARVTAAWYVVHLHAGGDRSSAEAPAPALAAATERFAEAAELPLEDVREGKVRRVDVKKYVRSVQVEPEGAGFVVSFEAAVTPEGTARPEKVVAALAALTGVVLEIDRITRTSLVLS